MTQTLNTPANFKVLVDALRMRGVSEVDPPRPMEDVSTDLGISRQHLYNLLAGKHRPPAHSRERLARAFAKSLGRPKGKVRKQLDADWAEVF